MTSQTESAELRARWRSSWLYSIQELSDLEMQRATWLNPHNDNPHYSFVEYVEAYLDDLALGDANGGYAACVAEGLMSEEEAAAALKLHALLERYEPPTDRYDHHTILEDPEWHYIVSAAEEAKASLLSIIVQPHERAILLRPSEHALVAASNGGACP